LERCFTLEYTAKQAIGKWEIRKNLTKKLAKAAQGKN
jgi:hypothetical protein